MRMHSGRRGLIGMLGLLLAGAVTWAASGQDGRSSTVTLSIVATNDVHGGLLPVNGRGGVELLAGYVENLRAARKSDGAVLLVDAGDMFQGTLESNLGEGAAVVAAYNALGYAAAAIGNHEFDFGVAGPAVASARPADDPQGALKARAAEAAFPFLAANLVDARTNRAVAWPNVRPSVLIERAGMRIGLVGVMTFRALTATIATGTRGLRVTPLAPAVAAEAASLRKAGADVVVLLAHAGGRCTRFDDPRNLASCDLSSAEIVSVVRALPRGLVDVVASGHVHAGMAHEVDGTIVMQAFSNGTAFSRADVVLDRATRRVVTKRVFPPRDLCARVAPGTTRCDPAVVKNGVLVPAEYEARPVHPVPAMARLLRPAVDRALSLRVSTLNVTLDTPIRRASSGGDSPLGNLFTDAFLASVPKADVAINNSRGGLRADLPRGLLTYGRLYESFPFDNRLVRLTLDGAALRRVFAAVIRDGRVPPGTAGIEVVAACGADGVAVSMRRPDGRLVRDADRLLVVTTDFLALGGDGLFAPITRGGALAFEDDGRLARDVVADWLRRRGGRLSERDLVADTPRWELLAQAGARCG
jgi:2',3'-cyclic-nucleotide 2'-phosphodiesterase (5'-nucleotidase family)